jgi:hypothetical protein
MDQDPEINDLHTEDKNEVQPTGPILTSDSMIRKVGDIHIYSPLIDFKADEKSPIEQFGGVGKTPLPTAPEAVKSAAGVCGAAGVDLVLDPVVDFLP